MIDQGGGPLKSRAKALRALAPRGPMPISEGGKSLPSASDRCPPRVVLVAPVVRTPPVRREPIARHRPSPLVPARLGLGNVAYNRRWHALSYHRLLTAPCLRVGGGVARPGRGCRCSCARRAQFWHQKWIQFSKRWFYLSFCWNRFWVRWRRQLLDPPGEVFGSRFCFLCLKIGSADPQNWIHVWRRGAPKSDTKLDPPPRKIGSTFGAAAPEHY